MQWKKREDLIFELYYSYNLENLHYHFNTRLNNLLTAVQLLLSSAIIGDLSRYTSNNNLNIFIGVILAVLSIIFFVYRFGEKAAVSKIAKDQYQSLMKRYSMMSDSELNNTLMDMRTIDSSITGVFADIAFKRSVIQLDLKDDTKLNYCELCFAKFCGEKF